MEYAERQTRSHLMKLFKQHDLHPRSRLGQNFLIDLNIIEFVVREAELTRDDVVLEVGAGTGGMTTFMAKEAGHVVSVELDQNMYSLAKLATQQFNNVTLINTDALKNKNRLSPIVIEQVEAQLAVDPRRRLKLVANLPYSVATPVMSNLVASELPWIRMVVTIQYELGLRMQAVPRTSDYSALSVWLQSQCHVELLKKLGPTVFWPRPKVDSAVMKLMPVEEKRAAIQDRSFFHQYIRQVFLHRRKLLRSVLCGMYRKELEKSQVDEVLESLGFESSLRAEELSVETHVQLANRLGEFIGKQRSQDSSGQQTVDIDEESEESDADF